MRPVPPPPPTSPAGSRRRSRGEPPPAPQRDPLRLRSRPRRRPRCRYRAPPPRKAFYRGGAELPPAGQPAPSTAGAAQRTAFPLLPGGCCWEGGRVRGDLHVGVHSAAKNKLRGWVCPPRRRTAGRRSVGYPHSLLFVKLRSPRCVEKHPSLSRCLPRQPPGRLFPGSVGRKRRNPGTECPVK
ncbi:unnamed protein product [Coccothraustes coccothraustes]